jgi:hypothetical protein
MTNLYIKNMVCDRCIMVVRQQLDEAGLTYKNVKLGEVELTQNLMNDNLKHCERNFHY